MSAEHDDYEFRRVAKLLGPELYHNNAIVGTALKHIRCGNMGGEQALVAMVKALAQSHETVVRQLISSKMNEMPAGYRLQPRES